MLIYSVNTTELRRMVEGLNELAKGAGDKVLVRALNDAGASAYTRVVRTLARETGAQQKEIRKAVKPHRSTGPSSPYRIRARGPYLSLKAFRPRQRKKGVSASPWGKRRIFPGTFIGPGGHVFRRVDRAKRTPIAKLWGPAIPVELLRGASETEVRLALQKVFPARAEHHTLRAIDQIKTQKRL